MSDDITSMIEEHTTHGLDVVARRTDNHPKGPKEIMRVPYGNPVPAGIIIGKDTIISLEPRR